MTGAHRGGWRLTRWLRLLHRPVASRPVGGQLQQWNATPPVAQGGSYVAADGSAWLSPQDLAVVRRALFHAAADERVHGADGVAYDSLRFRLGDDR